MHLSNLSLILLVAVSAMGCSGEPDSLSARAGRPSPEQVNKILTERYEASENFSEQIETIGGRIKIALDLSYTGLNNDDLEKLDLPKYLTQLDLAGTAVTDEGLDALEGCKTLTASIDLDHTQVTDECLEINQGTSRGVSRQLEWHTGKPRRTARNDSLSPYQTTKNHAQCSSSRFADNPSGRHLLHHFLELFLSRIVRH